MLVLLKNQKPRCLILTASILDNTLGIDGLQQTSIRRVRPSTLCMHDLQLKGQWSWCWAHRSLGVLVGFQRPWVLLPLKLLKRQRETLLQVSGDTKRQCCSQEPIICSLQLPSNVPTRPYCQQQRWRCQTAHNRQDPSPPLSFRHAHSSSLRSRREGWRPLRCPVLLQRRVSRGRTRPPKLMSVLKQAIVQRGPLAGLCYALGPCLQPSWPRILVPALVQRQRAESPAFPQLPNTFNHSPSSWASPPTL